MKLGIFEIIGIFPRRKTPIKCHNIGSAVVFFSVFVADSRALEASRTGTAVSGPVVWTGPEFAVWREIGFSKFARFRARFCAAHNGKSGLGTDIERRAHGGAGAGAVRTGGNGLRRKAFPAWRRAGGGKQEKRLWHKDFRRARR